jgi:hypothetical protein
MRNASYELYLWDDAQAPQGKDKQGMRAEVYVALRQAAVPLVRLLEAAYQSCRRGFPAVIRRALAQNCSSGTSQRP